MASFEEGEIEFNVGIVKLKGKLKDIDRQCAWELYAEIATRVAVSGKRNDPECKNFDGELLIESLTSLYNFFQECRLIMRKFPVGRIKYNNQKHLGCVIHDLLAKVLRPFLEKWQVSLRTWWESEESQDLTPFERQQKFPHYEDLLKDWSEIRKVVRKLERTLVVEYKLVDLEPPVTAQRPVI